MTAGKVPLGLRELQAAWRIEAVPDLDFLLALSRKLIKFVGMTTDGAPDVRHYPNGAVNGGIGIQVYQPLVESWLIISTWPEHGFTRINLSSCKPFNPSLVTNYLMKFGKVQMAYVKEL